MERLTDSRRLILDQHYRHLSQLYKDNDTMDSKAMGLLYLTSLILIVLVVMSVFADTVFVGIASIPLGLTMMLVTAWIPQNQFFPGTDDWDKIYEHYVNETDDTCFDQILSDCVETSDKLLVINNRKAKIIKISTVLFCLQWPAYLLFIHLVFQT